MQKENVKILAVIGIAGLIAFLIFSFGVRKDDVTFCREVFKNLTSGKLSVGKYIDWGRLKAMGVDVGATYTKLPNAREKKDYRKAFISNLSKGFIKGGGKAEAFTNWRVSQHEGLKTTILADYKNGTMAFTIYGYEKRQIIAIEWEKTNG